MSFVLQLLDKAKFFVFKNCYFAVCLKYTRVFSKSVDTYVS